MENSDSEAKVRSALSLLTRTDLRKLYLFGRKLLKNKQPFAAGRDGRDLAHDAVVRAFKRDGDWNPTKAELLHYLFGAIRSFASHLSDRFHGNPFEVPIGESFDRVAEPAENGSQALLERQHAEVLPPDRAAYFNQILLRMESCLQHDPALLELMTLLAEHAGDPKPGPTIQAKLGITKQQYHARMTKMRRAILRQFPDGI